MGNTFRDLLKHEFTAVFCNPHEFGTSAVLRTPGTSDVTIAGVITSDIEDELQGVHLSDERGRRETKTKLFTTAIANVIRTADVPGSCSTLVIDGETWQCLRCKRRDAVKQTIVVRRDEKVTTKRTVPRQ